MCVCMHVYYMMHDCAHSEILLIYTRVHCSGDSPWRMRVSLLSLYGTCAAGGVEDSAAITLPAQIVVA